MSDDPSGNTEAFRAFVQRQEPAQPSSRSAVPLIVAGALAAVAVLVVVLIVVLR